MMIFALGIALVYLDFSLWYSATMYNIWHEDKKKFRGVLWRLWDRL